MSRGTTQFSLLFFATFQFKPKRGPDISMSIQSKKNKRKTPKNETTILALLSDLLHPQITAILVHRKFAHWQITHQTKVIFTLMHMTTVKNVTQIFLNMQNIKRMTRCRRSWNPVKSQRFSSCRSLFQREI